MNIKKITIEHYFYYEDSIFSAPIHRQIQYVNRIYFWLFFHCESHQQKEMKRTY